MDSLLPCIGVTRLAGAPQAAMECKFGRAGPRKLRGGMQLPLRGVSVRRFLRFLSFARAGGEKATEATQDDGPPKDRLAITPEVILPLGLAISCVAHLAFLTPALILAGGSPFDTRPADAIMVDIVSPEEVPQPADSAPTETAAGETAGAPAAPPPAAAAPQTEAASSPALSRPDPRPTRQPPATQQAVATPQSMLPPPSFAPQPQPVGDDHDAADLVARRDVDQLEDARVAGRLAA